MQVNLRVLAGPYKSRVFSFTQPDTFLIGRSNDAHLCLTDDKFFSRHHCLLEINPPHCFLRDLGSTGGTVAIKTLLPEFAVSDKHMRRFLREMEVAAALKHPSIVEFIDSGVHNGVVYLVTEFVDGADAAKLADARGGWLPQPETLAIISQALDALSYAHAQGYIHRDIKDQNILVKGTLPNLSAKLTDFGLAKSFTQSGMSGVTVAGEMAGTLSYMPPERLNNFRDVKPQSDIYALGITAYSLL